MGHSKQLHDAFFEVLAPEGYSRVPDRPLSYVKRATSGAERRVDVEEQSYLPAFSVTLQELSPGGGRRFQLLEAFEGLHFYRFDRGEGSFEDALLNAVYHLRTYGLRWLDGESVETPAIRARQSASIEYRRNEALAKARTAFKAGSYGEALRLFADAHALIPLDSVDEKFRLIAERKAKEQAP